MTFEAHLLIPGYAPPLAPAEETADLRSFVEGVNCKNGHFNDPAVIYCQRCGISMAQQTLVPHRGLRPSLGVLLFDDSATYRLDADYVIGREPRELGAGARAIRLTYGVGGVSRQHVRVSLTGWTVSVIDLGSSNGTWIGEQRLEPGVPMVVAPGTRIEIARRWFRYESHRSGGR